MILTTGIHKDLGVAGLVSALHSPEYKQAMDAALSAPSGAATVPSGDQTPSI